MPLGRVAASSRVEPMSVSAPARTKAPLSGIELLERAMREELPIVAILGQLSGWQADQADPIFTAALKRAGRTGGGWKSLLSREPLPDNFYEWLAERFLNRSPSKELLAVADAFFSAVYTSSIDPSFVNLFATEGRQPEPVLMGDPPPAILRSRRRLPIYYLFGRAGAGTRDFVPPNSTQMLPERRLKHTSSMLRTIAETATPLGLIVVDGYEPSADWLRAEDLLAILASAPAEGVLWCGAEPQFSEDDAFTYRSLVDEGIIVREMRSLGRVINDLRATGSLAVSPRWDEPEIITLSSGQKLVTTPGLRLATEASAAIVDDSWLGFIPPLSKDTEASAFGSFHAVSRGPSSLLEGVRRGFAITRDFEEGFHKRVLRAIAHHHTEMGAIVLHGQSGIGKTIALGRLALFLREQRAAAVLIAYNRLLQPSDIADFLSEVDKIGGVTVVIVDATVSYHRYDDLLEAFRSRGHRIVIVGTSYRIDRTGSRFIEVPSELSGVEKEALGTLASRFGANEAESKFLVEHSHALARFFWQLPSSRALLSEGLGRETRAAQIGLRTRAAARPAAQQITTMAAAFIKAGYSRLDDVPSPDISVEESGLNTTAGKIIDYVMTSARLYKWLPVNLLLRAILDQDGASVWSENAELLRDLFDGQDVFRWRFADEEGEELLVGARLQIEAELICNRRLGGARAEAACLMELISCGVRARSDANEETKFLIDLVYALGPDGPFRDRYRESYASIARTLTTLRTKHGVRNARLMLQEATLRRNHARAPGLKADERLALLDEARSVIDEALQSLNNSDSSGLVASRQTRDNLWVERAATYGFLATDCANRGASAREVWSSYKAAREAVQRASSRVESYFPLDIGLWLPIDILTASTSLGVAERVELEADIRAGLDRVDPNSLDQHQTQIFQQKRMRAGEALSDVALSDAAFSLLERLGSSAGYYLRARELAPRRPEQGELATGHDADAARRAANYLWKNYDRISLDGRCLELLLSMEWTATTNRWLFRGQRQPLPFKTDDRSRIRGILLDLISILSDQAPAKCRYLEAVLNWIINDPAAARRSFNALARETEFVDKTRVVSRHVLTDAHGQPLLFEGIVERQIAEKRWAVFIPELSRHADLVESGDRRVNLIGKTLRGISVAFNYLGPIVDRLQSGSHLP